MDKINISESILEFNSLNDIFQELNISVVRLLNSNKNSDQFNYIVYKSDKKLGFKIILSDITAKKLINYIINSFLDKDISTIIYKNIEYDLTKDYIEMENQNTSPRGEVKIVITKSTKNYRIGLIKILFSDISFETKYIIDVDDVKPEPTKDIIYYDDYNKYKYLNSFEKSIYLLNSNFKTTSKGFPTITKVIWNVFENNSDYANYFYNWLAAIVQNPGDKRTNIAMCLTGKNNTGKGTVLRILKFIFNINYLQEDENSFKKEFNDQLFIGKFMVGFDEFSTSPSKVNLIKSYISEDTVMLEGKGKDRIQANNYTRFCITANTHKTLRVPIPITDGETDRRLAYFYSSRPIIPNKEHEQFDESIHVMTREELVNNFLDNKNNFAEECVNFIVFLHQYNVDDSLLRSIPPLSKGRKEALANSKTKNAEVIEDKIINIFQKEQEQTRDLIYDPKTKKYLIPTSNIFESLSDYERKGDLNSLQKLNRYVEKLGFELERKNGNTKIKIAGNNYAVYISKFPESILSQIKEMNYQVDFESGHVLSKGIDDSNYIFDLKSEYNLTDLKERNIEISEFEKYIQSGAIEEIRSGIYKIIDKHILPISLKNKLRSDIYG